jgi:hypothetical protein
MDKKESLNIRKIEQRINKHLYKICSVLTIVVMTMVSAEFFSRGAFPSPKIGVFYFGVLLIYSLHKELLRWLGDKKIERQGEYFVYAWVILSILFYIINFLTKDYFLYSPEGIYLSTLNEICFITLEVLAVFIITRGSKLLKIFLIK